MTAKLVLAPNDTISSLGKLHKHQGMFAQLLLQSDATVLSGITTERLGLLGHSGSKMEMYKNIQTTG